MFSGEDPFRYDKEQEDKRKGMSPIQFFVLFLVIWYVFAHHFF